MDSLQLSVVNAGINSGMMTVVLAFLLMLLSSRVHMCCVIRFTNACVCIGCMGNSCRWPLW